VRGPKHIHNRVPVKTEIRLREGSPGRRLWNPSARRAGDLEGPGRFSASEELAQKVVKDLAGYFDDVLVSRDSQLGLVILRQHTALDDHGVAIGDDDSGAQAVAAAPRRVVVDDFHPPA
jgi:hypothetical protein